MTETVGSSAWLRRVFEEEARDDLFAGHAPQEQPVLVLLGGQPAAGKTRAQHAILAEQRGQHRLPAGEVEIAHGRSSAGCLRIAGARRMGSPLRPRK